MCVNTRQCWMISVSKEGNNMQMGKAKPSSVIENLSSIKEATIQAAFELFLLELIVSISILLLISGGGDMDLFLIVSTYNVYMFICTYMYIHP